MTHRNSLEFVILDDDDEIIGIADTLSNAHNILDEHVRIEHGTRHGRLDMRNYGAEKDATGLWSERMELRLSAYSTRLFKVLMPAGWSPEDYHKS
jgi:hypothetical protein